MKKFIENISLREQRIGYELFNKKRLYEICGSYENYKSNKTPFCPRKLRLFLTSEFCDLSKVIPRKEDIKFIMMNPSLKEDFVKKYDDIIIEYINEIDAANWLCMINGVAKFNQLSERQFINIWREVNLNIVWNCIDEEAILTYMISTIDNIIKFKNILSRDTCNLNHFDNDIVIITLNHIKQEFYNPLDDEIHLINKEKYNHLKTNLDEYIKKTYKETSDYKQMLKLFNDMDYSYRFHETILDYENFSIKLYVSHRANPNMIEETKKDSFWNWNGVVERNDITIDFILRNRDIIDNHHSSNWLWAKISEAPYITNKIIIDNLDLPWKWQHVLRNGNLTFDLFDKLPTKITHQEWVWKHLSSVSSITEDFVKKHINNNWSWEDLIIHPNISRRFIKENIYKIKKYDKIYVSPTHFIPNLADKIFDLEIDIDFHLLSSNHHLSYELVSRYPTKEWEWADLLGRGISKNIIYRFYHSMPESIKSCMFRRESETAALYPIPGQLSNEYFNFEKIRHIKALRISRFFRDILYNPKYETARRNISRIYEND